MWPFFLWNVQSSTSIVGTFSWQWSMFLLQMYASRISLLVLHNGTFSSSLGSSIENLRIYSVIIIFAMNLWICSIQEKFPQCYSVLRFCFDFGSSVTEKPEAWSENFFQALFLFFQPLFRFSNHALEKLSLFLPYLLPNQNKSVKKRPSRNMTVDWRIMLFHWEKS